MAKSVEFEGTLYNSVRLGVRISNSIQEWLKMLRQFYSEKQLKHAQIF